MSKKTTSFAIFQDLKIDAPPEASLTRTTKLPNPSHRRNWVKKKRKTQVFAAFEDFSFYKPNRVVFPLLTSPKPNQTAEERPSQVRPELQQLWGPPAATVAPGEVQIDYGDARVAMQSSVTWVMREFFFFFFFFFSIVWRRWLFQLFIVMFFLGLLGGWTWFDFEIFAHCCLVFQGLYRWKHYVTWKAHIL